MDFEIHLQVLRMCHTRNITKGQLIRQIWELIKEHEGKDFKDLDDLFSKLYPNRMVQRRGAGVNIRHRGRSTHQRRKSDPNPRGGGRREPPYYDTPIQDLEEEAKHG